MKTKGQFNPIVMLAVLHVELITDTSNSIYIITDHISERTARSLTAFQTFRHCNEIQLDDPKILESPLRQTVNHSLKCVLQLCDNENYNQELLSQVSIQSKSWESAALTSCVVGKSNQNGKWVNTDVKKSKQI